MPRIKPNTPKAYSIGMDNIANIIDEYMNKRLLPIKSDKNPDTISRGSPTHPVMSNNIAVVAALALAADGIKATMPIAIA